MKKDIYILIVEDKVLARKLIHDHFLQNQITYAQAISAKKRDSVVKVLEMLE